MTFATVYLWGTKVGVVAFDDQTGVGSFEYERSFLSSGIELSPIVMPLSTRVYSFPELPHRSFHGLPGLLADSLPDKFGNAVIDAWLQSEGRSPESFNPVERLCYTGERGMGALEFVPATGPAPSETEKISLASLAHLASDILRSRKGFHVPTGKGAMNEIIRVGTSAGGARAKAVVAWNERTGDFRSGQVSAGAGYNHWLVKFDGVSENRDKEGYDPPQYTRIEYAYYLMASAAGINMEECRLYEEGGLYHFMTRRFDRVRGTGDKLHMQTLAGIAHYDFNLPGGYSYEQAAGVMRQMAISQDEIKQFYRRMVFNVLARNQDDHTKNISFLMDRTGSWSLSPAYDVTYAYNPDGMWTGHHQMTINGKVDGITKEDLLASAKHMGLRKTAAEQAIAAVMDSISKWPEYAEKAKLSDQTQSRLMQSFVLI